MAARDPRRWPDRMIREIAESEVRTDFLILMSEIEAGSWFDMENPRHVRWLERTISRRIGRGGRFYGTLSHDGRALGLYCLLIEDHPSHEGHAEVLDLGVVEEHRRQGHGARLLQDAECRAKDAGVCCLYVATYAGDAAAIAFYLHCGFTPVATLPGLNGPNERGQIFMQKELGQRSLAADAEDGAAQP